MEQVKIRVFNWTHKKTILKKLKYFSDQYNIETRLLVHNMYRTTMPKTITERWWDLYPDDNGCKNNFNGLHLLCSLYGDDEEDSDTLTQSMAGNKHHQLTALEFSSTDIQFKESLSSCMWNEQYPEGFFAHLQSELPDIRVISGIRVRAQIFAYEGKRLQTWEEWGRNIIMMDDEAKADEMPVWISGKKVRKILTEQQRTELEKRLNHYHGEERNGKLVVKDWYNPWMSAQVEEHRNYVLHGWQR